MIRNLSFRRERLWTGLGQSVRQQLAAWVVVMLALAIGILLLRAAPGLLHIPVSSATGARQATLPLFPAVRSLGDEVSQKVASVR
jgi:hypothetical protein